MSCGIELVASLNFAGLALYPLIILRVKLVSLLSFES